MAKFVITPKEDKTVTMSRSVLQATGLTNFLERTHKNFESLWIFRPRCVLAPIGTASKY